MLNLGWNTIGNFQSKLFAEKLSQTFKDDNLIHLDISHNNLSKESCSIIAQGLAGNHSLFGLHVEGNECAVDPQGYLQIENPEKACSEMHINNNLALSQNKLAKVNKQNHCWLCEGWCEKCFQIKGNVMTSTL